MLRTLPSNFSESTALSDLCQEQITSQLTLDNCIDTLEFADLHQIDELKVNCLKFISLNIASFFADGCKLSDRLIGLPIYLVRDLENFLKERSVDKYLWLDMTYFEL